MVLFPRKGDRLRAHSVFFQAIRVAESGKGIVSGMEPSRSSATVIAISPGTWTNGLTISAYAGGSITSIPAASSGKHRYDLIVLDTIAGTIYRIGGSEDTPTVISDFLENLQPLPPELASENQVLIAIIIVTSSGIPSGNFGHYATGGMANLIIPVRGQIDHGDLANKGSNTHAAIDSHIANASNPHGATAAQVGADITTGTIHAAASKGTPLDADELGTLDSVASYGLKKLTWANLKATLKTYFDGLYALTGHNHSGTYEPANANIQSHIANGSNPHSTTYGQVGAEPANANIQAHIVSSSNPHSTTYGQVGAAASSHASRHQSGGGDSIKLDDLASPDDNTDLDASTSKHGLMPKFPNNAYFLRGDGAWVPRRFDIAYNFGDGSYVLTGVNAAAVRMPINCTITAVRILELHGIEGSATVDLYKHGISHLDSFSLSGVWYEETGLNISLGPGDWPAIVISNITGCKQLVVSVQCEAA